MFTYFVIFRAIPESASETKCNSKRSRKNARGKKLERICIKGISLIAEGGRASLSFILRKMRGKWERRHNPFPRGIPLSRRP